MSFSGGTSSGGGGSEYDCLIRVVVVGDSGVGKTNLLFRFTRNEFKPNLPTTIGIDFSFKNIKVGAKTVRAYIWDTAGQDKFRSISAAYYRGTLAALLVYDITKRESFEHLSSWLTELRTYADENVVVILVGNKSDMSGFRQVSTDEAFRFAVDNRLSFIETSALENVNVEKAFTDIISDAYKLLHGGFVSEDKQMELMAHASRGQRAIDRLRTIRLNDEELSQDESDQASSPTANNNNNNNNRSANRRPPRPPVNSCCP